MFVNAEKPGMSAFNRNAYCLTSCFLFPFLGTVFLFLPLVMVSLFALSENIGDKRQVAGFKPAKQESLRTNNVRTVSSTPDKKPVVEEE